jgi:hypothetical protein
VTTEWVSIVILLVGAFAAGHMIGYHRGWESGYWAEHPIEIVVSEENQP